jgi:hypothetical protein
VAEHGQPALRPLRRRHVVRHDLAARQLLDRHPRGPQLRLERARALGVDLLEREAEALRVAAVPAGRDEDGERGGHDLAQLLGDRRLDLGVLGGEVAQQLHAEADVALLVERDVAHARAEARQQLAVVEVGLDEVLPRLGERRLDDQVVHGHGLGELRSRAIAAQLVRDAVQHLEGAAEAPGELGLGGGEPARDRAVADLDHLVHEAPEEDGVARLVDLLGGEEVLLLLARRGVDERAQVVGDGVLAVEEHRVVPQRGPALQVREALAPVRPVLGEVDGHGRPVALLPASVEVRVGDLVSRC